MSRFDLGQQVKQQLVERFLRSKTPAATDAVGAVPVPSGRPGRIPEAFTRFDKHPHYDQVMGLHRTVGKMLGLRNPFFLEHDGVGRPLARVDGREVVNFSSYNYLGLSGHPEVNAAAKDAIDRYGTSASSSRLVAGERAVHRELEQALAEVYGTEECLVFVSGHSTNMSTIATLFGPKDLVVHDSLSHNSLVEGAKMSGATRRSFPHNDTAALDALLASIRHQFERVLVVIEGHYSMDGDIPDLPRFIEIKRRHGAFLMVDEAHALGVIGATGKGIHEHFGVPGTDVDIWMGTLSKALAGCGGYIAGEHALIEHLKYTAPGFVYSVGMAPPLAAASLAALRIMQREPDRVATLQANGKRFLARMREAGFNTGLSHGYAIVPMIIGDSLKAVKASNRLLDAGVNVQPVTHPAVEEKVARLRFFLSNLHDDAIVDRAITALKGL